MYEAATMKDPEIRTQHTWGVPTGAPVELTIKDGNPTFAYAFRLDSATGWDERAGSSGIYQFPSNRPTRRFDEDLGAWTFSFFIGWICTSFFIKIPEGNMAEYQHAVKKCSPCYFIKGASHWIFKITLSVETPFRL